MFSYMNQADPVLDDDEIHQDEVIREKLEQFGSTAARHVWKDVCTDATALKYRLLVLLEWLFPMVIVYQQDSSRFYQDLQHLGIAFLLFLWGCYVLAPRQTSIRGKTVWNQSCNWLSGAIHLGEISSASSPSPGQSAAGSGSQVDEHGLSCHDDESDEERFEKFFASLDETSFLRRLVLSPSCRLVEKPAKVEVKKQQQSQKNKDSRSEEENPAQRLSNYCRQIWQLIRSIFWFDFVGAGWTLINWLQGIQRHRKNSNSDVEQDDDLAEDETVSGESKKPMKSPRSAQYHPTIVPETTDDEVAGSSGLAQASPLVTKTKSLSNVQGKAAASPKEAKLRRPRSDSELSDDMDNSHSTQSTSDGRSGLVTSLVRQRGSSDSAVASQPKKDALIAWRRSHRKLDDLLIGDLPTTFESPVEESHSDSPPLDDEYEQDIEQDATPSRPTSQAQHEPATTLSSPQGEWSGRFYFDSAQNDMSLKRLSIDIPVPDKNGYIVGDRFLSDSKNATPLLVFVNSRSGAQQGQLIITQLRRLLNPIQIWDLANGGPDIVLESMVALTRLRILVCGGDGTVSWMINSLEKMKLQRKWPPIAILPLGTGNDLARMHGWGGGYNNESLLTILEQISESYISLLDRWDVTINNKQSKKKDSKSFMNYLGVGADAQAALQVHYLRESRPDWFFSRIVNKVWYGIFGAEDIIMASSVNVRKEIKLVADGVSIPLPPDSQGIIILNIDSYAGGVPMWSHGVKDASYNEWRQPPPRRSKSLNSLAFKRQRGGPLDRTDSADDLSMLTMSDEERYEYVTACDRSSSCQDGILEIVSIRGAFHLGQIRVGLGNAQRLCQCREAVITVKNKVAVQIDGEPWKQRPCTIKVRRKPEHAVMLHRSMDDGGIEAEMSKLLDFAEERQLITREAHAVLMKEFSRRIESLTRQRRVREQDNIMLTLKKAISQNALASNMNSSNPWPGGIAF
ncbi:hypothetical protein MPSEU_000930500 [Mayamaea pseudoterrestris]|nr:hypothetical protein MPSEU_000930500 [Mayamaea pseudoterrestris]